MEQNILGKIFRAIGWRAYALADLVNPPRPALATEKEILTGKWHADKGDKLLRQAYDLTKDAVVFDVGGFEGQWASDIFSRYECRIYIFEPVPDFAENISVRFERNTRVFVSHAGLGAADGSMDISVDADASSEFVVGGVRISSAVLGFANFLEQKGIEEVALMKINIEGGEYPLLEGLILDGNISRIRELQVQFHDFVPHARARMECIQEKLSQTHRLTWQYPFLWENWRRIGS